MKTIGQITQEYHLDRGTLLKAAKIPHLLGDVATQSGHIWLIDDASDQFKAWLKAYVKRRHMIGENNGAVTTTTDTRDS